jgi:hypothetical protein
MHPQPTIHRSAWKENSAKFGFRIVNILSYQTGAKRHLAGLMHSTQHYILWCWMIMQLRA